MPAGEGAVRVPEDLGVVVRVEVDEAGGDVEAVRIEDLARVAGRDAADLGDDPVLDGDVRAVARHPRAVEDGPAADDPIVDRHGRPLVDSSHEQWHSPPGRATGGTGGTGLDPEAESAHRPELL